MLTIEPTGEVLGATVRGLDLEQPLDEGDIACGEQPIATRQKGGDLRAGKGRHSRLFARNGRRKGRSRF